MIGYILDKLNLNGININRSLTNYKLTNKPSLLQGSLFHSENKEGFQNGCQAGNLFCKPNEYYYERGSGGKKCHSIPPDCTNNGQESLGGSCTYMDGGNGGKHEICNGGMYYYKEDKYAINTVSPTMRSNPTPNKVI